MKRKKCQEDRKSEERMQDDNSPSAKEVSDLRNSVDSLKNQKEGL